MMRSIKCLFVSVALTSAVFAQKSPKESARVYVGIQETVYSGQQVLMQVSSSVASENTQGPGVMWALYAPDSAGIGTAVTTANQFVQYYPGRLYTYLTASGAWNTADIHFSAPPGYTVYIGQAYWPMTARSSCITSNFGGGSGSWAVNFYVVPNDFVSWLAPGFAKAPHVSDATWAVSLGRLGCGASAGSLRWQSSSLNASLLDSTALNFACPTATVSANTSSYISGGPVSGSTATWYYPISIPDITATYYDNNGYLKFIATNQAEFYVARTGSGTNGGYSITVYPGGTKFEWSSNSPNSSWTFDPAATPLDTYTIVDPISPGGTWSGSIQITRAQYGNGGTQTDVWTLASGTGGTTTLTDTSGTRVTTIVSSGASPRTESIKVANSSGQISLYETKTYQTFTWGEELISKVVDPSSMDTSGSALNLTTTYTYYNTSWGDGEYSKLQSVSNPDGSWVQYDYYTDVARLGQLKTISTPWQDAPTTASAATATNCKVVTQLYNAAVYTGYQSSTPVTSFFETLNAGSQTTVTGITTQQTSISSTFWDSGVYYTSLFANEPMRTDTIQAYSASGVYQTTVRAVFDNCSDPVYNGKIYSQTNPDGTKISASYWKGTVASYLGSPNSSLTSFSPSSSSATWVATYLTGTSTQQDPTAVQYTTDGITGGNAIDPVWMTPYKSFRRQVMTDQYGNPWYDVNSVFTGSGFQIISWHVTGYTADGFLVNDQDSSGSLTGRSYIDGKVNYQTNPDGTQIQYFFDSLMRVVQSEFKSKPAISASPALNAVETYFTYDASGHVLTTTKNPSGGGVTLTTQASYDFAGLQISQTDASSLVTSYSYANGGRTVTVTNPNGSTQTTDKHLDGTSKLVSGTGAINQYSSSAVNSDGTITTTVYLGTSTAGGSPRWSSTQTDWLGRTIAQTLPAFGSTTLFNSKQSYYNTLGQLIKVTQTGMAPTLYQYDGLGQLQYTALDVNNNGVIDLSGPDRITETRTAVFEDTNSIWWNRTQTSVFNVSGSSTPVLSSDIRQKLVPYASSQTDYTNGVKITETDSYDYYGNLITDVVNSGYQTGIVTETKTKPDSTVPQITTTYNGVLVSSQTAQNITTTYQYDGLYRETSEVDPRTGTSSTAYYTSGTGQTGQVSSHTDAAGNVTTYAYDSSDGRLLSQTDPAGNTLYHGYDYLGHEVRTWGTGTNPVEYAFDAYGAQIAMRTFRSSTASFGTPSWPLTDDSNPLSPVPSSWASGDKTAWTFDGPTGLLTTKTDASGNSVAYTYFQDAKKQTRTWARGVTTTYSYDPNTAELTGKSYSDGTPSLTLVFDRLGHRSSVVQTFSSFTLTTGLQYNVPGKKTQEVFDSTYFAGRQLNYQLDTTDTGKLGRTIGFTLGTSASPSSDQGVTFGFDTYGRFNSEGVTGSPTFTYNYQASSNLLSSIADTADGWSQSRTWEAHRNLLTAIQTSVGSVSEANFAYVYDNLGRRSSKIATGAIFARYPQAGLTDIYAYDSKSEVTGDQEYQSTNPTSPTTPVLGRGFTYNYDLIGNRSSSVVDATYTTSYTSNALNQITSLAVPGNYSVSGFSPTGSTVTVNGSTVASGQIQGQYYLQNVSAGNGSAPIWASVTASSSLGGSVATNAFIPQTPESPTYDLDGNMLTDGRWNYSWDAENRLISMETYGNQAGQNTAVWNSGITRAHLDFTYDFLGRRIDKKVSNWNGSAWVVANEYRYAYENWNAVAQYSVSGSSLTFLNGFIWGMDISGKRHGAGGVGGLLAMETSSGSFELPVYDANGNIQGLTDRTSEALTANYEYSPFGEILRASGQYAGVNPFRFASRYNDDETKLNYYGRRYYSAVMGRFLGRDPIGRRGGLNLYAYVGNRPVNTWDVLGKDPPPSWGSVPIDYTGGNYSYNEAAIGVSLSFSAYAGNGTGYAGTIAGAVGLLMEGDMYGGTLSPIAFVTYGGTTPSQGVVDGIGGSASLQAFVANTADVGSIEGMFTQTNLDIPSGSVSDSLFGGNIATAGSTVMLSAGYSPSFAAFGGGYSSYSTNTPARLTASTTFSPFAPADLAVPADLTLTDSTSSLTGSISPLNLSPDQSSTTTTTNSATDDSSTIDDSDDDFANQSAAPIDASDDSSAESSTGSAGVDDDDTTPASSGGGGLKFGVQPHAPK